MIQRINVGVIFGGKSAEHEVSLQSARNVVAALDKEKYNPVLIGIDKIGRWLGAEKAQFLLESQNVSLPEPENLRLLETTLLPGKEMLGNNKIDVVFPVLHGTFGEDGTVQGLLKLAGIPFVGASVLGSAVGMDKDVMKRLLRDAGLPTADFLVYTNLAFVNFDEAVNELGLPMFVKPANLGSSVGVFKIRNKEEFEIAIKNAFEYDNKIIIEQNIVGREIECSVLGNENPIASVPGEVVLLKDFYSYEAKYLDEKGALLKIPADLSKETVKEIKELAVKTYKVLCCEGMARVDFFLKNNSEAVVNEINTIPGFTKISMYPKLWQASGIFYSELLDRLIQLAIERFQKEKRLKTSY